MMCVMTLHVPYDMTSVVCARHRARQQSALPLPPQPPPPPLACVAPRAPRRDRPRPMSRSTRGGLEPHLGGPGRESNPQRRRKFGDGRQARANQNSCSEQSCENHTWSRKFIPENVRDSTILVHKMHPGSTALNVSKYVCKN